MPLSLEQKKAVVEEVHGIASTAHSIVAAEYRGLSVGAMTRLRDQARDSAVHLRVVRNTLAKRAFVDTAFEPMGRELSGPLVFAFSQEEPGAAARVFKEFARDNANLVVKILSFEGRVLGGESIDVLALLPTREQAIAQLMATLQAPVTQLVRTIAEPHARLVRTLGAIRDAKQAA